MKNMMKKSRKTLIIIIGAILLFPIALNFILQLSVSERVIGNETTWLNFWATYLGAIFSALMVYATFKTIGKTADMNLSQKRSEWLCSFRSEAGTLLSLVDANYINVLAQEILWGKTTKVMEEGIRLQNSLTKTKFVLNALLQEYDSLFNESNSSMYLDSLDRPLSQFYPPFREFVSFSIICDYLSNDNLTEHAFNQVLAMKEDMKMSGFREIVKAISSLEKLNIFAIEVDRMVENIKKATLAAIMTNLSKWDSSELERALLKICRDEAKGIHRGFSLVKI